MREFWYYVIRELAVAFTACAIWMLLGVFTAAIALAVLGVAALVGAGP